MKILSPVEFQLLAILGATEKSGREVAADFEKEVGKAISYGTLYTTFRRLKELGYVTVRDDVGNDSRVRFFALTGLGSRALRDARRDYSRLALFGIPEGGFA
ncbi:MAG TPA: PadR family transcriptional regulator [Lacunisphaera sp.]|nr:PadR family transcriptional regulator [Lacunisphaera sp.]